MPRHGSFSLLRTTTRHQRTVSRQVFQNLIRSRCCRLLFACALLLSHGQMIWSSSPVPADQDPAYPVSAQLILDDKCHPVCASPQWNEEIGAAICDQVRKICSQLFEKTLVSKGERPESAGRQISLEVHVIGFSSECVSMPGPAFEDLCYASVSLKWSSRRPRGNSFSSVR